MKKIFVSLLLIFYCLSTVLAATTTFNVDSSKMTLTHQSNSNKITNEFNRNYQLSYSLTNENEQLKQEIEALSRKTTYLLLGDADTLNESAEDYYKRHEEYLNLRYNPDIPKDPDSPLGLDMNSQEFADDVVSGMNIPSMFNLLDEHNIVYNGIDSIRVSVNDDMVISAVILSNVRMRQENEDNPMEYDYVNTNLVLYYFFKNLDGQYKLYYLFGETDDSLNEYNEEVSDNENYKAMAMASNQDSNLKQIYDFSKLDAIDENTYTEIYNQNYKNIILINSYYNNNKVNSAHGLVIDDGIVVTTWSSFEQSLKEAQYVVLRDNNGNVYNLDGIVTINPEVDLVVLKTKEKINSSVVLGSSNSVNIEDPVFSISSKSGIGLTVNAGIVTSNDSFLQHSNPITIAEQGSPLFNDKGEVIGLNTAKSVNSDVSIAIKVEALQEIKNKFNNIVFEQIECISFDTLKEKYYYTNLNAEKIINKIPKKQWNEFKKVGNIEKNISLNLLKASYDNNVISLRYENSLSNVMNGMQVGGGFINQLLNDGYKEVLNSDTKKIYQNNKYKVIIMDEFDYLIIVMVRL
ncbi:MAG: serine protease [Bacilli bacterium]|nr:serine protease [Bacilli bacterium]